VTKRRPLIIAACALALLLLLGSWAVYGQVTALSYPALVTRLRDAGATVSAAGAVRQPFFSVGGRMLEVNGEDVQTFEYPTTLAMELDARQVAPDGDAVGTAVHIGWVASPHFFKQGRLIVLYVGGDAGVQSLLAKALGPQFAGT